MEADRELAGWLVSRRGEIERAMHSQLGPAAPGPGTPESEALRRFRSFTSSALVRGQVQAPALDGLRLNERRVMALITAWRDAADRLAGNERGLGRTLDPLIDHFRLKIRNTGTGRKAHGRPRAQRRAVVAAIDRVADAFLAIDTDSGEIVDANPAAGSLLGVHRDALLGVDALRFVPTGEQQGWWTQLDAMSEGDEARTFGSNLVDAAGVPVSVDASVTRFATRGRTLALLLLRPQPT